jgi:hypothetical protein
MTIEETVDEIVELVFHSAAVSDDGYVQERAVRAGIWDLLEEFEKSVASHTARGLERELLAEQETGEDI